MLTKRGLATLVAASLMLSGCELNPGGEPDLEPEREPAEERCWNPPESGSAPAPGSQVTLTARPPECSARTARRRSAASP
jgi:hypothetical protein